MNKFNLTFSGEILPGQDPEQVRLRFSRKFTIDDPERLERFFSGQTITLRRNLDRKTAGQYFQEMRDIGVVAALVKVQDAETAAILGKRDAGKSAAPGQEGKSPGTGPPLNRKLGVDQIWAVSSGRAGKGKAVPVKTGGKSSRRGKSSGSSTAVSSIRGEERRANRAALRAANRARKERAAREEKARRAAEQEEQSRKAAGEKAERERQAAEEKAERERQGAEQAAARDRLKAEAAARQEAEKRERERQQAEQEARREAARKARERQQAEEAARQEAARKARERQQAEEAAQLQAELEEVQRLEAEEAARLRVELDRIKQQVEAEAERIRDAAQQTGEAARGESAARRPRAARDVPVRPGPVSRMAPGTTARRVKGRVKTTLDVPLRQTGQLPAVVRKRQPGEANLYSLRGFRVTDEVRGRAGIARERWRRYLLLSALALSALLAVFTLFLNRPQVQPVRGAAAIAVADGGGPVLLAGGELLLHDRAGVGTARLALENLGLATLSPPLGFDNQGRLVAAGRITGASPGLVRCALEEKACEQLAGDIDAERVSALVVNPVDGNLLLADSRNGQLIKISPEGDVLNSASIPLPASPVLRLYSGLLFINSAEGPAISVLRYDDGAFGQQLDEILLLPPPALEKEQSRVEDFVFSADGHWAVLHNPQSGSRGLYRFDTDWNFLEPADTAAGKHRLQLANWGSKVLVNNSQQLPIQRFGATGTLEAPLASALLAELAAERDHQRRVASLAGRAALLACLGFTAIWLGLAYLYRLRQLVYRAGRERGAEPIDDFETTLSWIAPFPNRAGILRRRAVSLGVFSLALLLVAIGQGVTTLHLAALLLLLVGLAAGLWLFTRQPAGHIAVLDNQLLLVDHTGVYHLGGGASLQYRGPFVGIDDVVVFTGNRLLPSFDPRQLVSLVRPRVANGIRVDRKTMLVKLLQARHPLAQGGLAILAAVAGAAVLLTLQGGL